MSTRIMLKDAGGLLTPERIRTLVPALKDVIGDRPLEVHTHSLTGLAPLVCLEAVEAGADCAAPFGGTARVRQRPAFGAERRA